MPQPEPSLDPDSRDLALWGQAIAFVLNVIVACTIFALTIVMNRGQHIEELFRFTKLYLLLPSVFLALGSAIALRVYFGARTNRMTRSSTTKDWLVFVVGNSLLTTPFVFVILWTAYDLYASSP